jgi:hypothetical protein
VPEVPHRLVRGGVLQEGPAPALRLHDPVRGQGAPGFPDRRWADAYPIGEAAHGGQPLARDGLSGGGQPSDGAGDSRGAAVVEVGHDPVDHAGS